MVKPFLIWHVTETSHLPCFKALDHLQLVKISSPCWGIVPRLGAVRWVELYFGYIEEKNQQTLKVNHVVVFAASLQCTDDVKEVSGGPQLSPGEGGSQQ